MREGQRRGTIACMAESVELSIDRSALECDATERFLRYVRVPTTSDRQSPDTPSTPGQWELARHLERELRELGITDVELDECCYLIARLPASEGYESAPTIGLMAHVDTASDVSGEGVRPQVHDRYDGRPIELPAGYTIDPADYPELLEYRGQTIITSDGSTLLGGDDKAGVAEIMAAVAYLVEHPEISHGELEIIFTPDEETGLGMNRFPKEKLHSVACYTLDGQAEGLVEAECFNAYHVKVSFTGTAIHLGYARGKLVNAVSMAAAFIGLLPRSESPEATDGYYGYYCPLEIRGGLESATLDVFIRDHDDEIAKRRVAALDQFARAVEAAFPGGTVATESRKQYSNMFERVSSEPRVMQKLEAAMRATGIEPTRHAIRGGTDGSRLTEMGIPTPNVSSGQHNMHSRYEWVATPALARSAELVIQLARGWAVDGG